MPSISGLAVDAIAGTGIFTSNSSFFSRRLLLFHGWHYALPCSRMGHVSRRSRFRLCASKPQPGGAVEPSTCDPRLQTSSPEPLAFIKLLLARPTPQTLGLPSSSTRPWLHLLSTPFVATISATFSHTRPLFFFFLGFPFWVFLFSRPKSALIAVPKSLLRHAVFQSWVSSCSAGSLARLGSAVSRPGPGLSWAKS